MRRSFHRWHVQAFALHFPDLTRALGHLPLIYFFFNSRVGYGTETIVTHANKKTITGRTSRGITFPSYGTGSFIERWHLLQVPVPSHLLSPQTTPSHCSTSLSVPASASLLTTTRVIHHTYRLVSAIEYNTFHSQSPFGFATTCTVFGTYRPQIGRLHEIVPPCTVT